MNIDELDTALFRAERRVLEIQTKLHRWAADNPGRRFDDLFNLVCDPAFLMVGWDRVRGNKGARTAGVDGKTVVSIQARIGVEEFLARVRTDLKGGEFRPLPVRERMIPKPGTAKRRRLGIPTVTDRVVQASLKLVLEPIFEADFQPCSYGFRPNRRAHDAVSEVQYLTTRSYEWVVEADIAACFDEISHPALMDRIRGRITDKRVLGLIKAFLKAGILGEDTVRRNTDTGTPQGGILSPLLANVALSTLDDHFAAQIGDYFSRRRRRHQGLANYRLIRYADDFVVVVSGTKEHAEALLEEIAEVLSPLGLRLAADKTHVVHITQGLDFLGWRIQRHRKRGTKDQH
ncbi:group II intron reverse transcriptase/maturase [Sphaerisporangium sp. NBC_01403]|uniref:group II intron reverse transcriptase/maturase n=1 Tax=Sphaerisporangium sp. NBC_01403 TaxID=2903599 RepID=UPI00324FBB76